MKTRCIPSRSLYAIVTALLVLHTPTLRPALAQEAEAPGADWPREIDTPKALVVVYQP